MTDKQWHRTKWLKPKKISSKLSHTHHLIVVSTVTVHCRIR